MRVSDFPLSDRQLAVIPMSTPPPCKCQGHIEQGMGFLDTMNPWVKYALIGGGALLLLSMLARPGKAKYKREMSDARDEYESRVRSIRRKYPRVGSRLSALPF